MFGALANLGPFQIGWRYGFDPVTGCIIYLRIHLPCELSDIIIDHLWSDTQSLKSCSLLCRTWRPASQFHLFRSIAITISHVPPFLTFIHYHPEIARYIRHVTLLNARSAADLREAITYGGMPLKIPTYDPNAYMALEPMLYRLCSLRSISFVEFRFRYEWVDRFLPALLRYFKRLKGLTLTRCTFDGYPMERFISHFLDLQALGIHDVHQTYFQNIGSTSRLGHIKSGWSAVAHVDLAFQITVKKNEIADIIRGLQNVKRLRLQLTSPLQIDWIPDLLTHVSSRNLDALEFLLWPDALLCSPSKHLLQHHFRLARRIQASLSTVGKILQRPSFNKLGTLVVHPMPQFRSIEWCFALPLRELQINRSHLKVYIDFDADPQIFYLKQGNRMMEDLFY